MAAFDNRRDSAGPTFLDQDYKTHGVVENNEVFEDDAPPSIANTQLLSEAELYALIATSEATMTVHNDTSQATAVKISNIVSMSKNFPNGSVGPGSSSTHDVSVSLWPGQSSFVVSFDNAHSITTKLGMYPNVTDASPLQFSDFKVAVMLSPTKVAPGVKYDFDYFVGPGILPPLVNGFVQANLPAILYYINKHGFEKKWEKVSIRLAKIGMNSVDLMCPYAGISNTTSTSADLNVIVKLNNTTKFGGTFTTPVGTFPLLFSLTNLAVMIQAHVSTKPPSLVITKLRMSLDNYNLDANMWKLLDAILGPVITAILQVAASSSKLFASLVNTLANKAIIDKINDAIKEALKPKQEPAVMMFAPTTSAEADHSTWMSTDAIQSKKLSQLHIPGTHDSGAYALSRSLPNVSYGSGEGIKYSDIAFLWALKPDAAPSNDQFPIPSKISEKTPLHVGKAIYDFVIDKVVLGTSQAGDKDIEAQLNGGIRHFDLRIYLDNDGNYYMQHGLRGPSFESIVQQVKSYIDKHSTSKELVIFALSHADYQNNKTQGVCDIIKKHIPSNNLLWYANDAGSNKYDFQKLADKQLKELVNGSTKVMFINGDNLVYPSPVTNTEGFHYGPGQKLKAWSFTTTPDAADIVPWVFSLAQGKDSRHLEALAKAKNATIKDFFKTSADNRGFNVYSVDWFEYSDGPELPVPQILALNG